MGSLHAATSDYTYIDCSYVENVDYSVFVTHISRLQGVGPRALAVATSTYTVERKGALLVFFV